MPTLVSILDARKVRNERSRRNEKKTFSIEAVSILALRLLRTIKLGFRLSGEGLSLSNYTQHKQFRFKTPQNRSLGDRQTSS